MQSPRYSRAPKPDYNSIPTDAEYNRRCFAVADHEVDCIHHVFDMHGVNASVNPQISIVARQFFGYAIDVHGGKRGRVQDVLGVQREIANAISSTRGGATPVRIQELPLMVEVANPWPKELSYTDAPLRVGENRMLAGIEYDAYVGRKPYVLEFGDAVGSILVAGLPGSGKSTLMSMMLVTMATGTSPVNLRLALVDLKGKSLPKFSQLPHAVAPAATSLDGAAALVESVYNEVIWRRDHPDADVPRLVMAIDELAELRHDRNTIERLNSIIALGREMSVNCLLATQYPSKEVLGGVNTININIKIAGVLNDARTAAYVTGREGTGAHKLPPETGSFISVHGNKVKRFQAFWLPSDAAASQIPVIRDGWGERLAGVALPPALHAVMRHNHPAGVPVTAGANHRLPPVITGATGENVENGADPGQDQPVITGDAVAFPLRAFRPLTDKERAEVRRLATLDEYRHQDKPSRNRLVVAVYGSKDPTRLAEIDRALAGDVDESKIIRLPQRAAQR